jgi:plasmid stabilization system protein ParE
MDRQLVWTETASKDIEAIVRYIALHDPKVASRIGFGIYDRAQILRKHPEAGTILEELRSGGWRKLIFRRWKIVYAIRDDVIIVGRVWPAALGEADLETPL